MINPRTLEAFRAVVRTGSTKNAAETLSVSQPGISRLIKSLEARLGYTLFERVSGRLVLTREGDALFEEVELYYSGLTRIEQVSREIGERQYKRLSVASLPTIGMRFLPELLSTLDIPDKKPLFTLSIMRSQNISKLLRTGQCDLGIISETSAETDLRIIREFNLDCFAILPKDHPLQKKNTVTWEQLSGFPFVGLDDSSIIGRRSAKAFSERGLETNLSMETHLTIAVSVAVGSGMGVSVVDPFAAIEHQRSGGITKALSEPIKFSIMVARPVNSGTSEHQTRFIRAFSAKVAAISAKENLTGEG